MEPTCEQGPIFSLQQARELLPQVKHHGYSDGFSGHMTIQ